ncbi:sialic acid-binding Ig-like lectin 14 isoform X2 [Parambassis ranga]|uniref:Sialic acid-binding Ig-like lectin 14 isoform X2 n=1 Tax=Parambassis ranga TaxID=210632 RepID=A0A6P7JYM7_9TELE|nr:sialic acid-binding Ig-like lectin 14 isoform X2 [Parambassis ranga]XP_028282071.1 sialic acid-binding Ig-like lectin 14 isoform X2 [Parambassis ranga]
MEKERKMMMLCLLLAAVCSPVFSDEWRATVVSQINALVSSCVVVPCTFTHSGGTLPGSRLRGLWYKQSREELIYYEDQTRILDNFKDRTKILGQLGQGNCTLEITQVRNHDNGPFCFRVEIAIDEKNKPTKEMFSFVEQCVTLNMLLDAPKPTLTHPKTAYEGKPYTITCSVIHTCPSHPPQIKWSLKAAEDITVIHKNQQSGNWEVQSNLTLVPKVKDDHTEITCTAEFNGQKTSSDTVTLYVKSAESYNHIIIPAAVGIGTALVFGVGCIFVAKKYKRRIAELQNQHRR